MAWTIVGVSSVVEATATPLTLTEPAGVADGDLLVACIASRTTATTAVTATGWTAVGSQNNNNTLTTGSALASGTMLYLIRSGTPTLAFTLPTGISVALGRIVAYRGHAATTPLDVATAVTTAVSTTSVSVTGLTTTQADDLIVAMVSGGQEAAWSSFNATTPSGASGATDTSTAPSATWRERADSVTTTGADTSLGVFDALKTAAGATGNLTATASVAAGHVVIAGAFKIKPYSETTAWNPFDKTATMTLSNSDKTATSSSGINQTVRSTRSNTTGKYYAEIKVNAAVAGSNYSIKTKSSIVSNTSESFRLAYDGLIYAASGSIGGVGGGNIATNDVVCVAWDATAKRGWFRRNGGNWNNNASHDPGTGVGGFDVSAAHPSSECCLHFVSGTSSGSATIRTEAAELTQTVPSGFLSWMGETPAVVSGLMDVWTGAAWVKKPMMVWTGSAWAQKPVMRWNGSAWV
jgi:hypothetical protein